MRKGNMANVCAKVISTYIAKVISTYMEFTLTLGLKLELKNTFKISLIILKMIIEVLYITFSFRTSVLLACQISSYIEHTGTCKKENSYTYTKYECNCAVCCL